MAFSDHQHALKDAKEGMQMRVAIELLDFDASS
jgi:hypothetical protein